MKKDVQYRKLDLGDRIIFSVLLGLGLFVITLLFALIPWSTSSSSSDINSRYMIYSVIIYIWLMYVVIRNNVYERKVEE